jgi:hypothetical protein
MARASNDQQTLDDFREKLTDRLIADHDGSSPSRGACDGAQQGTRDRRSRRRISGRCTAALMGITAATAVTNFKRASALFFRLATRIARRHPFPMSHSGGPKTEALCCCRWLSVI